MGGTPFCQTQQTDTAQPWGLRDQKNSTARVHGETCVFVKQHMALQRLQEWNWFVEGNTSPSFVLLPVSITVFGWRKQVGEAVAIKSHCWRAEPLELWCCLEHYMTQQRATRLCVKQNTSNTLIQRDYWTDVSLVNGVNSFAHQKHIAPMRGRTHPALFPSLQQRITQVFAGFASHPLDT